MADGKIRHQNHIIDSKAIQFIRNELPVEWVIREMHPDYGIDLDVELFEIEGDECVTLGEHIYLQVKGTESPQYGKSRVFGEIYKQETENINIDVLKFPIDVSLLKLVERMGSGFPVLLIVVDLISPKAYQICLNDYIRYVLPEQCPNFREQQTVTINIPIENILSDSIFLWYGKRLKLYSLFQEISAVADICIYSEGTEFVTIIRELIDRIKTHDAWKARNAFGYMAHLYEILIDMFDNDLINSETKRYLTKSTQVGEDWKDSVFYSSIEKEPKRGYLFAQEISCKEFMHNASGMASYFDTTLRHLGLPSTIYYYLHEIFS